MIDKIFKLFSEKIKILRRLERACRHAETRVVRELDVNAINKELRKIDKSMKKINKHMKNMNY